MKFTWTMDESEWKRLKNTQTLKKYDSNDYFGSCYIGGICCDFQHTMELEAWTPFVNLFYVLDDSDYGELEDGTRYELYNDSPHVPIKCKTFASFKKRFEIFFENFINYDDDLKSLIYRETMWNCVK